VVWKFLFQERLNLTSLTMMGHSFGGATALLTLGKDSRFKQVALKYMNVIFWYYISSDICCNILCHFNHVFPLILLDLVSYWTHGCSLWRKNWIYLTRLNSHYYLLLQRHFMLQQIFMRPKNTQTVHRTAVVRGLPSQ